MNRLILLSQLTQHTFADATSLLAHQFFADAVYFAGSSPGIFADTASFCWHSTLFDETAHFAESEKCC